MKKLVLLLTCIVFLANAASVTLAAFEPGFPSCVNPSGNVKVKYESGDHAIIGNPYTQSGEDVVYWQGAGSALQCFCPPEHGSGIQTNWWRIGNSLTQSEIDTKINLGWIFVPNGADWGLDPAAYLARNYQYSCNPEDPSDGIGGAILPTAASTSVLGLANTGGVATIVLAGTLGGSMFILGLVSRFTNKRR